MLRLDPQVLLAAYVTLLGACLGSFANVVIARLPEVQSLVRPRSRCPRCGVAIAWYDNLPVLSYLALRGRCRHCRGGIAARYPLVELLMAGLALALETRLGFGPELLVWLPLGTALVCIVFLDIDHFWIPDVITAPAAVWLLASAWLPGRPGLGATLLGALPALGLWGVGSGYARLAGREGLGLGDVKLFALLGMALGWHDALVLLLWAALQGVVLGSLVLLAGGHRGALDGPVPAALADDADWQPPAHAVPFGPFLVLAALEVQLLPEVFSAGHQRLVQACVDLLLRTS